MARITGLETRFGLHCAKALVGHFGARPDELHRHRDAINSPHRGLNKLYTLIIASGTIVDRAKRLIFAS
jgi:hypothetical protein